MTSARKNIFLVVFIVSSFWLTGFALASPTNGTIDSVNKYAWGQNIGWLNFGTAGGNIHITDSAVTGYAWSQNYGWIKLNPSASGVLNDSNGNLSGYAWGENLGYINFAGVVINSSGKFTGTASGTVAGQITFDCANCNVSTDWRPASTRTTATPAAATSGGGGGGGNPQVYARPTLPLSMVINNGRPYTDNPVVHLTFATGADVKMMAISNTQDFFGISQEPYVNGKNWNLCSAESVCLEKEYAVYVKFYTAFGQPSDVIRASIIYSRELPTFPETITPLFPLKPVVSPALETANMPLILKSVALEISNFFGKLFQPKPPQAIPTTEELAKLIPKIPPLPLNGIWKLLPKEKLNRFVFAPLPKDIIALTQKIPTLNKIFAEVGVNKQSDLYKLRGIDFSVPGLAKDAGLTGIKLNGSGFAPPTGIPLASLGPVAREKLPSEIIFARSADEKIDFNIKLRLNEKGQIEKRIETVVGSTIKLVVKAASGSKLKGYLVFRSKYKAVSAAENDSVPLNKLLASLVFSAPTMAEEFKGPFKLLPPGADIAQVSGDETSPIEERLALQEFDYTEPYHDGVFVAEIPAPRVPGEYDVITVIKYKNEALGTKEIRLTAVVDPEGYVYEQTGDKETRIPDATVSLYVLNRSNGQYEIWPARNYGQDNPQITDVRGTYSFLVPQGSYYITAEAPGYISYKGDTFSVDGANEVHLNIQLRSKYWFLNIADWKTVIIIMVLLLLGYNFYEDWKRKKLLERSGSGMI